MATLEHARTGEPVTLGPRVVVGRSPGSDLVLADRGVSGEHALIRWHEGRWVVRDLGSRNGTFVDEARVAIGFEAALGVGSVLRFGVEGPAWVALDLEPPDDAGTGRPPIPPTREVTPVARLRDVALRIRTSADEEYLEIDVCSPDGVERLPPRAFHDLILVLARVRLDHADRPDAEAGWVYFDELCTMLGRARERVNVDVFRARQQVAELGIEDAVDLFERRATTRQIRLGVAGLDVGPL